MSILSELLKFGSDMILGDWKADVNRLLDMPVAEAQEFLTQRANTLSSIQWVAFITTLEAARSGERGGEAYALAKIADGLRTLTLNEPFRSRGPEQIANGLRELEYEKAQRKRSA